MIQEWLWNALATSPSTARHLGYVRDFTRYKARWKRNAQAWAPHLDHSREFILHAAHDASDTDLAVVAGSGLCLDVPLRELSGAFREVLLIDLVHPWEVARLARELGNVRLIQADLTGALGGVQSAMDTGSPPADAPRQVPDVLHGRQPGFTVSANTLSLLPLIPMERLWATGAYSDTYLEKFAEGLIADHLAWLRSLPGVRCLLTDLTWLSVGQEETRATNPLHGVELPSPLRFWNWKAAPRPEAHPYRDVVHTVGGIIFEPGR